MKKYNTPEMKVSMFDVESVLTSSSYTMDSFDEEMKTPTAAVVEKSWADLNITF